MSEVCDTLAFEPIQKTHSMLVQSEIPNVGSSRTSMEGKVLGRSPESSSPPPQADSDCRKDVVPTSISLIPTKHSFVEGPKQHPTEGNLNNARAIHHPSLVVNAFKKPSQPLTRYSSGCVPLKVSICIDEPNPNRPTNKEDDGVCRKEEEFGSVSPKLYHSRDRKPPVPKCNVGEPDTKQVTPDKARGLPAHSPAKLRKGARDEIPPQSQTLGREISDSLVPTPPSDGSALVQGCSVLRQIGTPDFDGWLMKKEDYILWRHRYCMLKGRDFYWMQNNYNVVWIHLFVLF